MYSRERREGGPRRRRPESFQARRRTCYFCDNKVDYIDYKNSMLRNFINEKGRIAPAKVSGVCHRHQRRLARAIKQARNLALLPFVVT